MRSVWWVFAQTASSDNIAEYPGEWHKPTRVTTIGTLISLYLPSKHLTTPLKLVEKCWPNTETGALRLSWDEIFVSSGLFHWLSGSRSKKED